MAGKKTSRAGAKQAKKDLDLSKRAFLIYGDDEYLVAAKAKKLVEALCPDAEDSLALDSIEAQSSSVGEAVEALRKSLEALQTLGLFGGRKVVWIQDANFLPGTDRGRSPEVKARLDQLAEMVKVGLGDDQALIVTSPKVDGRSAFVKAFQTGGDIAEFSTPSKGYQADEFARERAWQLFRRAGLKAGTDVLDAFIGKTGCNTRQMIQEVEKLVLYPRASDTVSLEDVEIIVSSARDAIAWDFADAVGHRNLHKALGMLRQLLFQGENAVGLVIGLESRWRELLTLRECLDRRWLHISKRGSWSQAEWSETPEAETLLGPLGRRDPRSMHPFRLAKLAEQAQKFTRQELLQAHAQTVEAHEKIISGALSANLLLELTLLRLLGNAHRKAS